MMSPLRENKTMMVNLCHSLSIGSFIPPKFHILILRRFIPWLNLQWSSMTTYAGNRAPHSPTQEGQALRLMVQ